MIDIQLDDALDRLTSCESPWLIGVRHHSAALARVMPQLLDACQPENLLLEMPPDFARWLPFLGKGDLEAPVALAASDQAKILSFYPLADFSPELAAIRWAAAHEIPVIPCDLKLSAMSALHVLPHDHGPKERDPLLDHLLRRLGARDTGELWEKLVETPAAAASPESIRRAALYFGWIVRLGSQGPTFSDAHREAAMRRAITQVEGKSVAIVGSFHAGALLPQPLLWSEPEPISEENDAKTQETDITTSLIPYSFSQLDQRSGYPAGVMDPVWQQSMWQARSPEQAQQVMVKIAVELCRQLRASGHVASTPDATEVVRIATDLSRLRRLPAAGRGELLEAVETSLVQGDLFGRGRAVASAAQTVLVGKRRGRLPRGTPRSGLSVQVEETIRRLKLPGPDEVDAEPRELRLDPLRSRLDRSRAVVLRRFCLLGIRYGERFDGESVLQRENLTEAWRVQWTHATPATMEAAGIHGAVLEQACDAAVRRLQHPDAANADDDQGGHPKNTLLQLTAAAECGLPEAARRLLARLNRSFLTTAATTDLIEAALTIQRIAAGHFVGLPRTADDSAEPDVRVFTPPAELLNTKSILEAALRDIDALRGSDEIGDVISLVDLTAMIRGDYRESPSGDHVLAPLLPVLIGRLQHLRRDGSPLMQGTACGALAMVEKFPIDRLAAAMAGWYDAASNADSRRKLRARLAGLMIPLLPLVAADAEWLSGLEQRLETSADNEFLPRLPALRGGFQSLSAADRAHLLNDRLAVLDPQGHASRGAPRLDDPEAMAIATAADRAGRSAIVALLPDLELRDPAARDSDAELIRISDPPGEITLADRWRLVLGVKGCRSPQSRRIASALDQLYGASSRPGQGHQTDLAGPGGGTEAAVPSAREWIENVEGLFDKDVCEEVLAEAAGRGRAAVLEHLNPNTVTPSVDLLEQVLALRGALPERDLALLRKLARRITERLAEQLAKRLRPALTGLSTARPTYRRSPKLDFSRTLARNLKFVYRREDGHISIAPQRLVFRKPAKRQMDWHLIFVVDVSGSMEASVIYSALVAAIFSSLPAVDVRFFAFSTEVLDFTDTVDDPLSMLMEVQVGGGTHIGLGLRAARQAIKNPTRTMVVLVTDFEEGVSVPEMLSEVKMMSDSQAKLIGLAALDDEAKPRYHAGNAAAMSTAGMAVAAVSPERLAQWVGDQIRGTST